MQPHSHIMWIPACLSTLIWLVKNTLLLLVTEKLKMWVTGTYSILSYAEILLCIKCLHMYVTIIFLCLLASIY